MAIDTTGGAVPSTGEGQQAPKVTRASDLQQLDDKTLLEELNLGTANQATPAAPGPQGDNATIDKFAPVDSTPPTGAREPGTPTAESQNEAAAKATGAEGAGGQAAPAETQRPLQAQFAVFDEAGEELEVPALNFKFKAAGELRDLPLDRVVKLAQQGFYNEQRAEEMRAFREREPQIEQYVNDLQSQNQMLVEGWRRILSGDEQYLIEQQQEFLQAQSPEARAQRLAQENAYLKGQTQQGQTEQQAAQFVNGHLVPSLQRLEQEHPEVSFEEIVGRFNLLTAPYMVRGQIPPARFQDVARLVESELRPWVDSQNDKRSRAKQQTTQATQRATAVVAAAKRQVAQAVMPQGTQPTGQERTQSRQYKTAADILDDLPNIAKPTPV